VQALKERIVYTTEVNRSKFITYLIPISEYEGLQATLKKENPKANHVVYALRYLNGFDQIVENASDDGEPKGCAGVPTLNVLRGENIINCAVLIVRYFGGIKLGTGGMARAYALAVKNALAKASLDTYVKKIEYHFTTSYSQVDKTLYFFKKLDIIDYEREFRMEDVEWKMIGSLEQINMFKVLRS
jgi:uncharacterized YigZ family protein